MARIFLSHSSENSAEAIAVHDWLVEQGWNDLFLDLHPERGLKAGQRWQEALKRAAERCEAVLFLISPAWAASKWCLAEFLLAKQIGKAIFGIIIEPIPFDDIPREMTAEWQLVDLIAGARDHELTVMLPQDAGSATVKFASEGLARLRIGLMQSGLDPKYFKWPADHDPDRSPYRGLKPLEAEDAGIFFGREGPIIIGLDILRSLREGPAPRILVILGASGAGKSSFMRAGLLPRLAREDQHFLPLPVIRPERAALTGDSGLIASIENAMKAVSQPRPRADIRAAVEAGITGVVALFASLAKTKSKQFGDDRGQPTIVVPIDQAEELFATEGAREGETLLALIGRLAAKDAPAVIALFTMRSDSYEPLQTAHALDGLRQHAMSLAPMPHGAYAEVIKGPARRLEGTERAVRIDDALIDGLLADIEAGGAKDALPLLAFTLERLYGEYHAGGHIKLEHYNAIGRVQGSIEAAVDRAFKVADDNPKIPRDREARLALLRRGLIPWLAGIDAETGAPRRRVARLSEIPAEARPLIDQLVEQRLLSTDVARDTEETTIEPTHEALLRQWGLLRGWLKEDSGLLAVLEGIQRAARDWAANYKASSWLAHNAERLNAANRLAERPDLAANLESTDREYLAACRKAEQEVRNRARRSQFAIYVLLASVVAGLIGWINQKSLKEQYYWRMMMVPSVLTVEQERVLALDQEFSECAHGCPTMVVVPAGRFMMGSTESEKGRTEDEGPLHQVTIAKPFAVGKYVVTFAELNACVIAGVCARASDSGWGEGNRPAIYVNWDEAKVYVAWLSRMTGKEYRLLTEAEWEYAARAGTTTQYSWGDEIGNANANCDGCGSRWDNKQTSPVGSFKPNAFGLYDMHGNVWQWTEDCYHNRYNEAPKDASAWTTGNCGRRMVRGGAWLYGPSYLRAAYRDGFTIESRNYALGFRVARTLTLSP
jgi:formylglycine-generating enzyme required for sulfatase activity